MDDDDLRRGKATVHVAFDEATAVLAGDSLLALAFQILCDPDTHPDGAIRAELTRDLAHAAGALGMAGGQMLDLQPMETPVDLEQVTRLQRLKTGAIIAWAVEAGAVLGRGNAEDRLSLRGYAQNLGLAFQIADDLLDVEGDAAALGKPAGADAALGKTTFVTQLGIDGAKQRVRDLLARADSALAIFGTKGDVLRAAARFVAERKN
jgi:farnesyl diphosphate synthase